MKSHTIEGQALLDRVGGRLARVGEIVRSCHERWDGQRLPRRAARRGDPAGGPHRLLLRRLLGDDHRPPLPRGDPRRRPRSPSCAPTPARSSSRASSRPSARSWPPRPSRAERLRRRRPRGAGQQRAASPPRRSRLATPPSADARATASAPAGSRAAAARVRSASQRRDAVASTDEQRPGRRRSPSSVRACRSATTSAPAPTNAIAERRRRRARPGCRRRGPSSRVGHDALEQQPPVHQHQAVADRRAATNSGQRDREVRARPPSPSEREARAGAMPAR